MNIEPVNLDDAAKLLTSTLFLIMQFTKRNPKDTDLVLVQFHIEQALVSLNGNCR